MYKREDEITIDELAELLSAPHDLSPVMYQYYKGLKERRIIINEQITQNIVETVMMPLLDMDNDGTGLPIEIILCTVGGSIFDGMPLCDIIDGLKTKTTITTPTYAYSMGGLILMAGYNNPNVTKRCYKHSTALLHAGSTYLSGNSSSVRDTFNFHQDYEKKIKEYTLSHSKISEVEYDKMERFEWYMTSDKMLEKGLVDEII